MVPSDDGVVRRDRGKKSDEAPQLRIGCSGWQYKHWRGLFYPRTLPVSRWFAHYASQFDTVEINNSFYRLPDRETFASWQQQAPAGFVYAVKASRYLTHMKKLKDPAAPLERLFDAAEGLGQSLGPVLYQLPPQLRPDLARLRTFLHALPVQHRHAIEFRDPAWYTDDVFEVLECHGVALCLHDMQGSGTPRRRVGPFVYARFHGPARYSGSYSTGTLAEWGQWLSARRREGLDVYAYFNNDIGGHAPRDAVRLRTLLTG